MEYIKSFIDLFLHLDTHLSEIITQYGTATYAILFAIIFIETGLVIMPLLPGDSLLFAAGAFAAKGDLDIALICILLFIAAVLGDTLNYHIGKWIGPQVFNKNYSLLKKEYLTKTQEFYDKHGGKTIIFARFIPIIRTFAPFVAGVGTMKYSKFIMYNIIGAALWIVGFSLLGYYFGNIPAVKKNFTLVIVAIIILSVLPPAIEYIKHKMQKKA
ncbi:MAG: DedA family protein [Cytophagales bacterium]|nr:DedA family protein [Cytophagales bacterium]